MWVFSTVFVHEHAKTEMYLILCMIIFIYTSTEITKIKLHIKFPLYQHWIHHCALCSATAALILSHVIRKCVFCLVCLKHLLSPRRSFWALNFQPKDLIKLQDLSLHWTHIASGEWILSVDFLPILKRKVTSVWVPVFFVVLCSHGANAFLFEQAPFEEAKTFLTELSSLQMYSSPLSSILTWQGSRVAFK